MFQPNTAREVREVLVGRTIKNAIPVRFSKGDREIRGLSLQLDNGTTVRIDATSWQALKIEA
jgi:hypothetical protein